MNILHLMTAGDAQFLADYFKKLGWNKPLSQFEAYIQEAQNGLRTNLVAKWKDLPVGYVTILW
ncbi:MAG: hypothetical protein NTV32_07770 [Gammaproteobacteria bacterium]|nr:hypothetical protein [Gammaproteobacteria bacterium]